MPIRIFSTPPIAFSGLNGETHWVHMKIFEGVYDSRQGLDGMDAIDTLFEVEKVPQDSTRRHAAWVMEQCRSTQAACLSVPEFDMNVGIAAKRHDFV